MSNEEKQILENIIYKHECDYVSEADDEFLFGLIEKQNKIIDLMSKELTNIIDATEEEIKECFRKKVEE